MKYFIFLFTLIGALSAQAQEKQSLKDLLYGGKLKKDSSGVIRSTDDLSSKIDTSTKKPVEAEKPKPAAPVTAGTQPVSPSKSTSPNKTNTNSPANTAAADVQQPSADAAVAAAVVEPAAPAAALKTNTRLWKEYIDTLTKNLKTEVLTSKQIKKGDYYVTIDYEIGLDGAVVISKVTSGPENALLQSQVQQMLEANPPHLNPYLDGNNQPKKVKRKQNFSITKD
jgi:hypothetical protein